jgi:hypothetical protein
MKKLLLALLLLTNLFSWDDALLDAMYAFNRDSATPKQKALILKNNAVINQMRIKGQISDSAYQKTQNYYSDFVQDLGKKVCEKNGATMVVQKRDMTKSYDAGTDSDFITNATSVEQVKAIQRDFNKEFEAHLIKEKLDISKNKDWTAINDIDFMVDPDGVDRKTFKEISKIQNDAYSDPDSARYEKKSRNGEQLTPKEIAAYKDEMRRFIDKKKKKSIKLSEELMEMKKNPNFNKTGTKEWKQRQLKEAKLQQINAQNSKYHDRAIHANQRLSGMYGANISSSSLPNRAKNRAPSLEISAEKRAIDSATVNSINKHLSAQSDMNEALLLSVQATEEPQNAKEIQKRIEKITKDLTPSQKGEFIQRIKNSEGVSNSVVKNVNNSIKKQTPQSKRPLHVKSSKLAKVGSAFGLVGDLMSIDSQLSRASKGEHLLINFNKDDSSLGKALKGASITLLELAPVPIMDTLQRYDIADKKAKQMILNAIKRGEDVDPALLTAMVFSDVAGQTVNAMVIDPLLKGKDTIVEGISTATTVVENYQNKKILEKDDAKNTERFNEYVKRAETIKLSGINTSAKAKNGSTYTVLDNVGKGDRLYFFVQKNENWKSEYSTSWEIRKGGSVVKKYPSMSASSGSSNRLAFTNSFSNGNYQIIFRIFNEESKQMDYVTTDMRVNQKFGISPIVILNSSKNRVSSSKVEKDKRYIFGINPIGSWDSSYTIEWFLDGDKIKTNSADASQLQHVWVHFDDYVGVGGHQVSVRAIKDGKIVAHQSVSVHIKQKKKTKKLSALEKLNQKMKKEKNKTSLTQSDNSKLNTIFEEGAKKLEVIDANAREEAKYLAKAEQIKRDMKRRDREDAEFWRGLAEGFAVVGKAVSNGANEYQKKSSQYSSNTNHSNGHTKKLELGLNLNTNKSTQKTKSRQYGSQKCITSRCWKETTKNGDKVRYQYLIKNGREVLDGEWIRYSKGNKYYKKGQLIKKGYYRNGCKDGSWTNYYTAKGDKNFKDIIHYSNCKILDSKRVWY